MGEAFGAYESRYGHIHIHKYEYIHIFIFEFRISVDMDVNIFTFILTDIFISISPFTRLMYDSSGLYFIHIVIAPR